MIPTNAKKGPMQARKSPQKFSRYIHHSAIPAAKNIKPKRNFNTALDLDFACGAVCVLFSSIRYLLLSTARIRSPLFVTKKAIAAILASPLWNRKTTRDSLDKFILYYFRLLVNA